MPLNFPNNPVNGTTYTSAGILWTYDGTKWVTASTGAGGTNVTISDTPPATPKVGDLWYDSVGGQLYCYYQDVDGYQWVVANSGFVGAPGPQGIQGVVGPVGPIGVPGVLGGRNFLHNALFNIQQRGAGPWTASSYTVDRWQMLASGDTVSAAPVPVTDAIRSATGDEAFTYFLSNTITGSSAAGSYSEFVYKSESARRLSGKTVTLSFWAWSAGSLQLGLSVANVYGTTGSPSPADVITLPFVQLTPSVTRYTRTFTVPSAVGKTFGGAGTDFFQLQFWSSTGANNAPTSGIGVQSGTVNIMGPQLEIGSAATALEKLDYALDLENCQRFYQTGYFSLMTYAPAVAIGVGTAWALPVTMRTIPTLVIASEAAHSGMGTSRSLISDIPGEVKTNGSSDGTGSAINWQGTYTASADL